MLLSVKFVFQYFLAPLIHQQLLFFLHVHSLMVHLFLQAAWLQILGAHLASTNSGAHLFTLECVRRRTADKLPVILHSG